MWFPYRYGNNYQIKKLRKKWESLIHQENEGWLLVPFCSWSIWDSGTQCFFNDLLCCVIIIHIVQWGYLEEHRTVYGVFFWVKDPGDCFSLWKQSLISGKCSVCLCVHNASLSAWELQQMGEVCMDFTGNRITWAHNWSIWRKKWQCSKDA